VTDRDDSLEERSTARDNHQTVVLNSRTGASDVVTEGQTVRDLIDATRRAQERGDLKLLANRAA